jgi:dipeptidyl aminopeptidase/acylaminoacyl peptidase
MTSNLAYTPITLMKTTYFILLFLGSSLLSTAQNALTYQRPVAEIATLLEAPSTPSVSFSPDRQWMALLQRPELPSIEEVSRPELRLAGLRIDPNNFGPSRSSYFNQLQLRQLDKEAVLSISGLPQPLLLSGLSWSPDGKHLAFLQNDPTEISLWVVEVATRQARRLSNRSLNAVLGNTFSWLANSRELVFSARLQQAGPPPQANRVPAGPIVEENLGKKAPSRTYQDLLKNPDDEKSFEYYAQSELVLVDLKGASRNLVDSGLWSSFDVSPNDQYLLCEEIVRPYSYLVPYYRFASVVQLRDMQGTLLRELADKPMGEYIPSTFNAVEKGPRGHAWRPDQAAVLYWAEALDEGDPQREVTHRDRLLLLEAPFEGAATEWLRTELRYGGVMWADNLAWVRASWTRSRKEQYYEVRFGSSTNARKIRDRSYEDAYTDPGRPLMTRNAAGRAVMWVQGGKLFMSGQGASTEGDRPFLDQYELASGKSKRLWQSAAPHYESVVALLDPVKMRFITSRESPTENPNYYLRTVGQKNSTPITRFAHPYPQLAQVQKSLLRYQRADGVEMTADLYLPASYDKSQGPLPTLVWAYPREFKSQAAASQVKGSPYRFTRIGWGSPVFWVLRGYAVLDNASMPIVGEGEAEPNDTYIKQLVANAEAIVRHGSSLGVVDSNRVAVGGHSYGAFMTANLLAHSTLFKAGIARSGAYNRTLTPFGFQAEERTYWQAPEVYFDMSPFSFADRIKTPLMLIHGEADNNPGTFPIQSERLYQAVKGHGGTVRYVVLPHESHGYRASESVLHMLWEMDRWLEKYVKP